LRAGGLSISARLGELMAGAAVGIHTMWNEHFGIGVVEMMAAGLATVAHDSGGPQADIVVDWEGQPTGLRATNAEDYAVQLGRVLAQTKEAQAHRAALASHGRRSVYRFSDEAFSLAFVKQLLPLLPPLAAAAGEGMESDEGDSSVKRSPSPRRTKNE